MTLPPVRKLTCNDTGLRPLNVILFGETGSGKSSVINLLVGSEVAKASPDVGGCTKICDPHTLSLNGKSYTIWDTVGLEEPMMGATGHMNAIEQVCKLIKKLLGAGGVNLLLFCHRHGRITTNTRRNYALLYNVVCQKSIPIAVVVTHLEHKKRMEDWWDENAEVFRERGINVLGHACVTTLQDDPKARESREAIEGLLQMHDGDGRYLMPDFEAAEPEEDHLVENLRRLCNLPDHDAHRLAKIIEE